MMKNKGRAKNVFLAFVILGIFLSSIFHPALAQYKNQEKIPGAEQTTDSFIQYMKDIINFGFAVIGILALFMLVIGAYQYLIGAASGNVAGAKETIGSALLGLILGLCAYVILNKINPDLVNMREITKIQGATSQTPAAQTASQNKTTQAQPTSGSFDKSKINCDTVRNYSGFLDNSFSTLQNETKVNSAADLKSVLTNIRTGGNGLTQYADTIYQSCKDNGVPFWYAIGTFAKESNLFSEGNKGCSQYNNPGCMKSGSKYIQYSTPEQGIQANIENMGRRIKDSSTALETWNKWYWPDGPGNCAGAQEYLDLLKWAAGKTGLSVT
jgi:hypothetical protein